MSALDDDPYLAELLDLTNEELGDGNEEAKKAGATASRASQASASSAAAAAASSSSSAAAAAASSSQPSPAKAPSYRSSDTHRETLKLLSQLSPSMAKIPSESDVRGAFQELFGPSNDDDEDFDATQDEEKVQRALEEHLDVADLEPRLEVIREEMLRLKEEREQRRQSQSQGLGLSQSLSQQSLGDELSQSQATGQGKKRRRVVVPGGKSELPLMLPKGLATAAEGSGKSKGPKSLLVELDERDKGQDLTGDSGAVGRVHVSKKQGMVLDLKGHQYLASMTRCPALLLVSVGEEEAKVEDVVENLCVLTHLRDHLQTMGGQLIKGAKHDDDDGGEDEEDYSRFNYGDSDAENGKPAVKTKKKAGAATKASSARGGAGKKGGGAGGKGKGKGAGGGGRKSAAAGAKKKTGPKKVSLTALKPKKKKGADSDEDEESSYSEPDDDSDSDFSI